MTSVEDVRSSLEDLMLDEDVPQGVAQKLKLLIENFEGKELSLAVNQAQSALEDISEDVNIPPFVKTQIWSIQSQLASLEAHIVNN